MKILKMTRNNNGLLIKKSLFRLVQKRDSILIIF